MSKRRRSLSQFSDWDAYVESEIAFIKYCTDHSKMPASEDWHKLPDRVYLLHKNIAKLIEINIQTKQNQNKRYTINTRVDPIGKNKLSDESKDTKDRQVYNLNLEIQLLRCKLDECTQSKEEEKIDSQSICEGCKQWSQYADSIVRFTEETPSEHINPPQQAMKLHRKIAEFYLTGKKRIEDCNRRTEQLTANWENEKTKITNLNTNLGYAIAELQSELGVLTNFYKLYDANLEIKLDAITEIYQSCFQQLNVESTEQQAKIAEYMHLNGQCQLENDALRIENTRLTTHVTELQRQLEERVPSKHETENVTSEITINIEEQNKISNLSDINNRSELENVLQSENESPQENNECSIHEKQQMESNASKIQVDGHQKVACQIGSSSFEEEIKMKEDPTDNKPEPANPKSEKHQGSKEREKALVEVARTQCQSEVYNGQSNRIIDPWGRPNAVEYQKRTTAGPSFHPSLYYCPTVPIYQHAVPKFGRF